MIAPNAGVGAHINIPILAGAALGYRANSGDWPTIQQQQGSRTQARVTSAGYRAARNLDAPWNPLRPLARQQSMYLRKEHEDNRTRTAVSVAMYLRDTLTFRKPKPTFQGADTVTIYVVYALRVLDTSSVAFDLWNSERWERGEVAAYEVPAEHHLGQIDVERFYARPTATMWSGASLFIVPLTASDGMHYRRLSATRCASCGQRSP